MCCRRREGEPIARVAVIGYGRWGRNVARDLAATIGANLVAVVDVNAEARARARVEWPGIPIFADLESAPGVADGVAICTPTPTHGALAAVALAAGLGVLVEKPLAMDGSEAAAIEELATRAGRVLMVGHQLLYHPIFCALVGRVRAGDLGEIRALRFERTGVVDFTSEPDVLWAYAPHDVAMALSIAGEDPVSLECRVLSRGARGQATAVDLALRFESGPETSIRVDGEAARKRRVSVVSGTRASAVFDDGEPGGMLSLERQGRRTEVLRGDDPQAPLRLECRDFIARLTGRKDSEGGGRLGVRVASVLAAAARAMV